MINSRTTNYFNAKYPWLYRVSEISTVIFFFIWLFGITLGIYILSTKQSGGMMFWLTGWTVIGSVTFIFSFWWRLGTQTIETIANGLRITKRFGLFKFSKSISFNKIHSLGIKQFEPFNPLTGTELKPSKELGWLLINDDPNYFIHSYLYDSTELKDFISECEKNFG